VSPIGHRVRRLLAAGLFVCLTGAVAQETATDVDLSGKWEVTTACNPRACGIQRWQATETIRIQHKGTHVTIRTEAVGRIKADIQGGVVTWSRTYSEDGGKTVETGSVRVAADGGSFDGTSRWFWTDGQSSCRGDCVYSGDRKKKE